jgi:hypothetical protein
VVSYEPPVDCPGKISTTGLAAGWRGHRVHADRYQGGEFNFTAANNAFRGGRFDSHLGEYGYLYLASSMDTAVDETIVRNEPFDAKGARAIPLAQITGKIWSEVELSRDVPLVDLRTTTALAGLGQDYWLVHSESYFYPQTRVWARAVRAWAPSARGFIWHPRHNREETAIVLFANATDPDPDTALLESRSLETGDGLAQLRSVLADRNIEFGMGTP